MADTMFRSPIAIICSVNRPEVLHETVLCLTRQTVPCSILISVPAEADVLPATRQLPGVEVLLGARGASAQRNRALRSISGTPELIAFLDDDMEVEEHYIEELQRTYREHASTVLVNGANLAHGIYPAGTLNREIARKLIQDQLKRGLPEENLIPARTGYGSRMSFRGSLLGKVEFDERLPLYSYMEDYDFTLECRIYGSVGENPRALGVHIELSSGRVAESKRGYSEIVNPVYIWSKRTGAALPRTLGGALKRTLKNAAKSPNSYFRKRLFGNLLGWSHLLVGKIEPEYILKMK
jgi:GT2 family glycosyltransferase